MRVQQRVEKRKRRRRRQLNRFFSNEHYHMNVMGNSYDIGIIGRKDIAFQKMYIIVTIYNLIPHLFFSVDLFYVMTCYN